MKKKFGLTLISIGFLIVAGICYSCACNTSKESGVLVTSLEKQNANDQSLEENIYPVLAVKQNDETAYHITQGLIYIHICGAVAKPGVYQTNVEARLIDLIELAGGLNKDAAGDFINQAQPISDGQRIYIPTQEELKELSTEEYIEGEQSNQDKLLTTGQLININKANQEELMKLPGIGQAKADSIIEYRTTKGNFNAIEELMNIPGIKEGLFGQISSSITVK